MTQVATVERIVGKNRAEISVLRQSACGGNCAGCSGCGSSAVPILVEAVNLIQARPRQKVIVESSTRKTLGIAVMVYLVPIILFLTGYLIASALTDRVAVQYTFGGLLFLAGFAMAIVYDRKQKNIPFYITRLF